MKNVFIIFILSIIVSFPVFAKPQESVKTYSSVIEDLPLMPYMSENNDESIIFDKPDGRIIESIAIVNSTMEKINKFYKNNLPPLGWKYISNSKFIRDNEILTIKITTEKNYQRILFILTPKK